MKLSLLQYKELLTIALDHQLARLKGGIVFDEFDPAVEGDKLFRARVEKAVNNKNIAFLKRELQRHIDRFRYRDEYDFASILFEKTIQ
jgi:stalled ribosome alternative rescue factor ArfA